MPVKRPMMIRFMLVLHAMMVDLMAMLRRAMIFPIPLISLVPVRVHLRLVMRDRWSYVNWRSRRNMDGRVMTVMMSQRNAETKTIGSRTGSCEAQTSCYQTEEKYFFHTHWIRR